MYLIDFGVLMNAQRCICYNSPTTH